jgi:hypothetical protein
MRRARTWSSSLIDSSHWESLLVSYRRRRAYVRGHLWLLEQEFLERTNRADRVVLPDLTWYTQENRLANGTNRFEPGPWKGPLDPALDRSGYEDRLLKALTWRIVGFRKRVNTRGQSYNKPVWVSDWGGDSPPHATYLRACRLINGSESLDDAGWARVISEYRERFHTLQRWASYYRTLMVDMESLESSMERFERHADEHGMLTLPTAAAG